MMNAVCETDPPAAWTTRPRVVVILEDATLADSGSKPDKQTTSGERNPDPTGNAVLC